MFETFESQDNIKWALDLANKRIKEIEKEFKAIQFETHVEKNNPFGNKYQVIVLFQKI